MNVGRNEPCPCGSRKKFKTCCEGKNARRVSRGLIFLLVTMGAIAAVGLVASIPRDENPRAQVAAAPPNTPRPQPPGPAPAGKVWSPEHGHWHDPAVSSPIQIQQTPAVPSAPAPTTPQPQPPGPAPAGKVWSPEHGHWHEAPAP